MSGVIEDWLDGCDLKVNVNNYKDDKLYPKILKAVDTLLHRSKVVRPVDVLIEMDLLDPEQLEDWRFGRINYLERVIRGNLTRLSRLLRILRFHAHDLNLSPSTTVYKKWGKGRSIKLRFSKTGDAGVEKAYSRHYVWPAKLPFHEHHARKQKSRE